MSELIGLLPLLSNPGGLLRWKRDLQGLRGGTVMMIPVMYKDGSKHLVSSRFLDRLLSSNQILAFRRSGGWVVVGRDQIREKRNGNGYKGPEKRLNH